ncbi:MAG: hypothetical protein ABI567_08790 [Gammaproteobacteria bacterium]
MDLPPAAPDSAVLSNGGDSEAMILRIPLRSLEAGRWVSVENGPDTGLWVVRRLNHSPDGELVEIHMTRAGSIPPGAT